MEELRHWCNQTKFDLLITLTCQMPMRRGSYFFESLVATAVAGCGVTADSVRDELESAYQEAGASHVAACYMHATKGTGRLSLQNLSKCGGGFWFV